MDDFDQTLLMDLVGHVYEAAADPQHWNEFLNALERIHPGSRITLFGHEKGRPAAALTLSKNFGADDLRAYVDHHVTTSPYIARVHRLAVGKPAYSETLISDAELQATDHFNDYVRPRRLGHYATGVLLDRRADGVTALSIADHKNDAARRARQVRLLEILTPHLLRAYRLHRTLAAERERGDATRAAFDCWAHAALVLGPQGRVITTNRAADVLLGQPAGLWIGRDGRLHSIDENQTRTIDRAVRSCAAIAAANDPAMTPGDLDGIALPRTSGAAPLRAMLWPLPFLAGVAELAPGAVLMLIFDPDQVQRTPVGWLARQFGLTASEQRLTEAIVNGVSLADAAEQLGIRVSTARQRLKIIQTKTHCHRQVDLVRLAYSLPTLRPS
jgi:DNA-binding CsgD family transcriptional regulator/PAS domain-containing protein